MKGEAMKERIYESKALTEGWTKIGDDKVKTWWFDTEGGYPKRQTLDQKGAPIVWDDETFTVEIIKECIEEHTCTAILSKNKKRVLVVICKALDHVIVQGSVQKKISWEDYTRDGLWAVKKHCKDYTLVAVVLNPMIKTLEKYKVLKTTIKKVIAARDFLKRGHSVEKENATDQGNPAGS